jgi:hypothetical protein
MGYRELPGSLGNALEAMENSELVAEALGEHVFDFFLRNKRTEWETYRSNVTPTSSSSTCPCSGSVAGSPAPRRCVTVLWCPDPVRPNPPRGARAARRRTAGTGRADGADDLAKLGWNTDKHIELLWSLSRTRCRRRAAHHGPARRGAGIGVA